MSELLTVVVDGVTFYVETAAEYGSEETGSLGRLRRQGEDALDIAKSVLIAVAKTTTEALNSLVSLVSPQELTVEFALKFSAEGNAILTKIGSEANLRFTMKYKTSPQE